MYRAALYVLLVMLCVWHAPARALDVDVYDAYYPQRLQEIERSNPREPLIAPIVERPSDDWLKDWNRREEQRKQREKAERDARKAKDARVFYTWLLSIVFAVSACYIVIKTYKRWEIEHWATALVVILLLAAVIGGSEYDFMWNTYALPYGFYTFLRLSVSALCILYTCRAVSCKAPPALILLPAAIGMLYQPIIKVEFEHGTWCWVNIFTILALAFIAWRLCICKLKKAPY